MVVDGEKPPVGIEGFAILALDLLEFVRVSRVCEVLCVCGGVRSEGGYCFAVLKRCKIVDGFKMIEEIKLLPFFKNIFQQEMYF